MERSSVSSFLCHSTLLSKLSKVKPGGDTKKTYRPKPKYHFRSTTVFYVNSTFLSNVELWFSNFVFPRLPDRYLVI